MMTGNPGSDMFYRDHLEPAEAEERQRRRDHAERVAAPAIDYDNRPHIDDANAHRLRTFASTLIAQKRLWQARADRDGYWQHQINDPEEIITLCTELVTLIEPVIQRALCLADQKEKASG